MDVLRYGGRRLQIRGPIRAGAGASSDLINRVITTVMLPLPHGSPFLVIVKFNFDWSGDPDIDGRPSSTPHFSLHINFSARLSLRRCTG